MSQDEREAKRERRKILKRLDKVRKDAKTCPASRHVHIIIEGLLDADSDLARALTGYEPEHMAGSIASVLEGLWQARRWLKWENLPPTGKIKYNGHWVPDLDAIATLTAKGRAMQ